MQVSMDRHGRQSTQQPLANRSYMIVCKPGSSSEERVLAWSRQSLSTVGDLTVRICALGKGKRQRMRDETAR